MHGELFVGVMSGTSLDGVDAVLAGFDGSASHVVAAVHRPFDAALRAELFALQASGSDELARAAAASNALADGYADAIVELLAAARIPAGEVRAAGVHGQTVRHDPAAGWTLQLNNGARVAERAGVTVVVDFRSRDIAAGGQGAPLVPAFHAAMFARPGIDRAIVNIGGIANVTLLPGDGGLAAVRGFDTGPGNALMDLWCSQHTGAPYDEDGAWGRSGRTDPELLRLLLDEAYFSAPPPKSTGRDLFNTGWLAARLQRRGVVAAADVQRTLMALTARSIADALAARTSPEAEVIVCGGGALNSALLSALAEALAPRRVTTTGGHGVDVLHVEALAFAWLARQALAGQAGNLPAVTGAAGPRVLGAIYPR